MELLVSSLEQRNVSIKAFNKKKIYQMRRGDILHLHWPSFNYSSTDPVSSLFKSSSFLLLLAYFRVRGIKIVWTVHNLWPHKGGANAFNRLMRTVLCSLCSSLIVMGESVKHELTLNFKASASKMVLVPHGHYRDAYTRNGLNVRKRYDIPEDAYLFAFIGRVSPYKGIDQLLASFQELSDERTHLLIAGKPSEDVDQSTWNAAVRQENVHLSLDFVEDGELADYIHGADCIVLPYRNITTSGSAILALSCLRPVVAPNIGLLSDYLTPETSILYDPVEPGALTRSMKEIREKMSFYRDAGPYEQKLEELEWKRVSELLVGVYNSV